MAGSVDVRIRRRYGNHCVPVAGRCYDSGEVDGMGDHGRIAGGDRKKGRRKRMADQPQRSQIVVPGARRPGDGDGVVFDAAVFSSHDDGNRVGAFG